MVSQYLPMVSRMYIGSGWDVKIAQDWPMPEPGPGPGAAHC